MEHDGNPTFIKMANDMTIKRARNWIVANSRKQLEELSDQVTLERLKERIEKDDIKFMLWDDSKSSRLWSLANTKLRNRMG